MITEKGGFLAYLGTDNINEIESMIESGNKKAKLILEAMAYQIGKEIGAVSAVLHFDVDVILLMGSILNVKILKRIVFRLHLKCVSIF